jgi:hypothetical protein
MAVIFLGALPLLLGERGEHLLPNIEIVKIPQKGLKIFKHFNDVLSLLLRKKRAEEFKSIPKTLYGNAKIVMPFEELRGPHNVAQGEHLLQAKLQHGLSPFPQGPGILLLSPEAAVHHQPAELPLHGMKLLILELSLQSRLHLLLQIPPFLGEPQKETPDSRSCRGGESFFAEELLKKDNLYIRIPGISQGPGESADIFTKGAVLPRIHTPLQKRESAPDSSGGHPHAVQIFRILRGEHPRGFGEKPPKPHQKLFRPEEADPGIPGGTGKILVFRH